MSSLYHITIAEINGTEVKIQGKVIHPDAGPVPTEKNFALQMLVELYWLLKKEYLYDLHISKEKAKSLLAMSPYISQYEEWLTMSHGYKEPVSKAIYEEVGKMDYEARRKHPQYGKLSGWGSEGVQYYLHHNPDYAGFVRLAEIMILNLKSPKKGLLVFNVLEEGMLAHIEVGMSWETAAFDYRYA